jgi:aspartyl protease family protein
MHELPRWLKHATIWLLLATGLFVAVLAWQKSQSQSRLVVEGGTLVIQRSADGHYHWPGQVDGREVDFLIDTGATGTAIPSALAQELGLQAVDRMRSSTAGGVVQGTVVVADLELQGGLRAERLRMTALPKLQAPLLGMDVLGKLRWQQADGVMRIELRPARP